MYGYYNDEELSQIGFGSIGKNVMISRSVELANVSHIHIGNNSRVDSFVVIAPSGNAIFRIGENVQICAYTILNGLASITFEDFSSIGPHGSVLSSRDDFEGEVLTNATVEKDFLGTYSAPVVINRHAVIATGTTILPGVTIGEGTVVGAHSLVKNDTTPYTIFAGIPAKMIRQRSRNLLEVEKKLRLKQ